MRNENLIDDFIHDLGYALRILRRSPGFTVTADPRTGPRHWRQHRDIHGS